MPSEKERLPVGWTWATPAMAASSAASPNGESGNCGHFCGGNMPIRPARNALRPCLEAGLFALMGGDSAAVAKLDAMFDYDTSKLDYSHAEDIS